MEGHDSMVEQPMMTQKCPGDQRTFDMYFQAAARFCFVALVVPFLIPTFL